MKSFKKIIAGVCSLVMLSAIATSVVSANDELGSSIGSSIGESGNPTPGTSEDNPTPGTSEDNPTPGTSEDNPTPGQCSGEDYMLGDVNGDGEIKSNDLLLLKKYLLGLVGEKDINLAAADVTKDGIIRSNDLLLLKKYLLNLIDKF